MRKHIVRPHRLEHAARRLAHWSSHSSCNVGVLNLSCCPLALIWYRTITAKTIAAWLVFGVPDLQFMYYLYCLRCLLLAALFYKLDASEWVPFTDMLPSTVAL